MVFLGYGYGSAALIFLRMLGFGLNPLGDVGVVIGIDRTVFLAADFTDCLICAGCSAAGVSTGVVTLGTNTVFPLVVFLGYGYGSAALIFLRMRRLGLNPLGGIGVVRHVNLAVFAAADRTDSPVRAVCGTAVAILGFRMAGVTLTDSGVGPFIAVLRPLAPVVVKRGIRCGKRIGVIGAYFTARTGQIIHRVIGAVRRSFHRFGLLNLLCVGVHMDRRPVGVEGLRTEHCHGGVFFNLRAAGLFRVPTGKIVSLIAGNRQRAVGLAGRQRFGFVRFSQRTAVGVKGHSEGLGNRAGNKVQLLVILILHMGIDVVREEILPEILAVSIGKCHGVAGILGGHADGRPGGHADLDGQRLAGGQIHIVGLAGNRVVLHEGLVSDLQLAAVAGIDINAAAIAAGFVILDLTAIELADRAGAVNIYAAAVAAGRIAGNFAALHRQPRWLLIQIDGAAVLAGVSGDLAVIEEELAALVKHMNRAAFTRGPVAGDLAAPHVERCRLI